MRAGHDFLTGVAALIEIDRVYKVEIQHVRRELLGLRCADKRIAILNQEFRVDGNTLIHDVEIDL